MEIYSNLLIAKFVNTTSRAFVINRKHSTNMAFFTTMRNNVYFYKDCFMDVMMYNLFNKDKEINWEYVEEKDKFFNNENSIKNNSRTILIRADIPVLKKFFACTRKCLQTKNMYSIIKV